MVLDLILSQSKCCNCSDSYTRRLTRAILAWQESEIDIDLEDDEDEEDNENPIGMGGGDGGAGSGQSDVDEQWTQAQEEKRQREERDRIRQAQARVSERWMRKQRARRGGVETRHGVGIFRGCAGSEALVGCL